MNKSILNKSSVLSPITGTNRVSFQSSIAVEKINNLYKTHLNIETSCYFKNIEEIKIFTCDETGYRFYYPFNIAGDGFFYEQLQKNEWYYMPWKWEHEQALKLIKPGMKVLEVGCGRGSFLKEVGKRVRNVSLTGLELNQEAIEVCKVDLLHVLPEMIEHHAQANPETYDLVCSFQVLEHVSDIRLFLESKLMVLKRGGLLVISVPNNDSFTKYDFENDFLNMPPHHMGLWTQKSLKSLTDFFSIKHTLQKNEPLQAYHLNWFLRVMEKKIMKNGWLYSGLFNRFRIKNSLRILLSYFPGLVHGHTTIVVFKKT